MSDVEMSDVEMSDVEMTETQLHQMLTLGSIALSVMTFMILVFISAPYGRHARGGWGPTIDNRLGWILMEAPAAVVIFALWLIGEHRDSVSGMVLLALWELHYLNRAFIYPLRIRGSTQAQPPPDDTRRRQRPSPGGDARAPKRMPIVILVAGFVFNSVNGYLNGRWLFTLSGGYPDTWLADPRFWLGAALFLVGFAINLQADQILRNLRQPGDTGYSVPQGGLFRWITSPNYLGEILEWTGWAIATWSMPGLAFALWTAANLIPRARDHHRWYQAHFDDYPRARRVIVPYVF